MEIYYDNITRPRNVQLLEWSEIDFKVITINMLNNLEKKVSYMREL